MFQSFWKTSSIKLKKKSCFYSSFTSAKMAVYPPAGSCRCKVYPGTCWALPSVSALPWWSRGFWIFFRYQRQSSPWAVAWKTRNYILSPTLQTLRRGQREKWHITHAMLYTPTKLPGWQCLPSYRSPNLWYCCRAV